MSVVRWRLQDFSQDPVEEWTFEINPVEGGTPQIKKNLNEQPTTASDGISILFEGAEPAETMSVRGTILYQEQLEHFQAWWRKKNQLLLTDDLGRTFWVLTEGFEPTRKRSIHFPWRHDYTASMRVVVPPAT